MSRLTFRDSKGELWIKDAADIDEQGQICMLTDRLAAYEDIGLEPKQVRKIANVLQEVGQEYNCRFEFVAEVVEKYAKYVDAERDGRLVVLPCKVGDTVYVISHCENVMVHCDDDYETGTGFRKCPFENSCEFEDCDDGNKRIFETTCTGFYLTDGKSDIFFEDLNAEFYLSAFGKTVFLTRAEAEAALAQDGGHDE